MSNRAYEAREAAVTEMARLKSQSDREHQVFESEFKELGRLIEHDRKMRDYMRVRTLPCTLLPIQPSPGSPTP